MSLGNRLLMFITHLDISKNKFGTTIGMTSSENVRNLTNGRTKDPRTSLIIDILINYPQLNARWLLTGKGTMLNDEKEFDIVNESAADYGTPNQALLKQLINDRDRLLDRLERQSEEIGRLKQKIQKK